MFVWKLLDIYVRLEQFYCGCLVFLCTLYIGVMVCSCSDSGCVRMLYDYCNRFTFVNAIPYNLFSKSVQAMTIPLHFLFRGSGLPSRSYVFFRSSFYFYLWFFSFLLLLSLSRPSFPSLPNFSSVMLCPSPPPPYLTSCHFLCRFISSSLSFAHLAYSRPPFPQTYEMNHFLVNFRSLHTKFRK